MAVINRLIFGLFLAGTAVSADLLIDKRNTAYLTRNISPAILPVISDLLIIDSSEKFIIIDNGGGDLDTANKIIALIQNSQLKINCVVTGSAFSAAFNIFLSCPYKYAKPSAQLMFHRARRGLLGNQFFSEDQLYHEYASLRKTNQIMLRYLAKMLGLSELAVRPYWLSEKIWSPAELNNFVNDNKFIKIINNIKLINKSEDSFWEREIKN